MESEIGEFEFKPLNEGLGFHRKVKPLEAETDSEDSFSFSAIGAGTLDVNSREQSKSLLSSPVSNGGLFGGNGLSAGNSAAASSAKAKHNTKSVSDLIAALPPSFDLLLDEPSVSTPASANGRATAYVSQGALSSVSSTVSKTGRKRAPLFGPPSDELATPGAPAAASFASSAVSKSATQETSKKGFLNLPLGRHDYGLKSKTSSQPNAAMALDENLAKTFPTVFPHLGSLAGQPAAAALKAPQKGQTPQTTLGLTTSVGVDMNATERPIAAHFGSAILDTLVSIGVACLFLSIALAITGANLLALLENSQTDQAILITLATFFVGIGLLYVLAARTWVGATLGEWSYEVRVGNAKSRKRWFYPILVLWRGGLVAVTGFVIMPLISLIAGRDVLKYLTGLELSSLEPIQDYPSEVASRAAAGTRVNHASENPA